VLFNVGFLLVQHVSTLKKYDEEKQASETLKKLLQCPITDLEGENQFISMVKKAKFYITLLILFGALN